jgi:hypothetical protein
LPGTYGGGGGGAADEYQFGNTRGAGGAGVVILNWGL